MITFINQNIKALLFCDKTNNWAFLFNVRFFQDLRNESEYPQKICSTLTVTVFLCNSGFENCLEAGGVCGQTDA
jgi:hypothetical protein